MTTPLILQIQEAALDSKSSVTDALRKAKIACVKLELTEFRNWVDLELNGYKKVDELPQYRKLNGVPEAFNQYHGWKPIIFHSFEQQKNWSLAPIGMSIAVLEDSMRDAKSSGVFDMPYPPEIQRQLRESLKLVDDFHIKLHFLDCSNIVHAVRNILLDWTLAMEKQGIRGENLTFSPEERERSATVTAQTINIFHNAKVGSVVQNAENSVVQGGIDSTLNVETDVRNLVQRVEQLLPAANLEPALKNEVHAALDELQEAANSTSPDSGRLRKGLEYLKRVLAPAGEHALNALVDAAVTKVLGF